MRQRIRLVLCNRLVRPLGLALAWFVLTGSIAAREPTSGHHQQANKAAVQQVLVPIIVTDRKGEFVTDLRASDFRVFEDGVGQRLSAFYTGQDNALDIFPTEETRKLHAAKSPTLLFPESKSLAHHTYVVALDARDLSSGGDFTQWRDAVKKLFKEEQAFDAQYLLVTLGQPAGATNNLTQDAKTVLASRGNQESTGAIKPSETSTLAQKEPVLMHKLEDFCGGVCRPYCRGESLPGGNDCSTELASIVSWANTVAHGRVGAALGFVEELRDLTEQLSRTPGRRVMILSSDDFDFRPGGEMFRTMAAYTNHPELFQKNSAESFEDEIREIVKLANAGSITFYTLRSQRPHTIHDDGSAATQGSPVTGASPTQSAQPASAREERGAMSYLAEATGGTFNADNSDILEALHQALADGREYYVLAYRPSNQAADGQYRTIKVQVKGKGLTVRGKRGYWAASEESLAANSATHPEPPSVVSPALAANVRTTRKTRVEPLMPAAPPLSFVDATIADLIRKLPELKNLKPVASQDMLPSILQRVGANVATLFKSLPNVTSREQVSEQRLVRGFKRRQINQEFRYLALPSVDPKRLSFEEYRTDSSGQLMQPTGIESGFQVTQGFVSVPRYFHPSSQPDSRFRYLGQEAVEGRRLYVVAFAQTPAAQEKVWFAFNDGSPIYALTQGLAWIDPANAQIVRMRTDLMAPVAEIKLESQTTKIKFSEVHFKGSSSGLWLPLEVEVETKFDRVTLRNTHTYSEFKQFSVQTQERQGEPALP